VTGTTLFATHKLKEVNGYDEFYHGWGAEDTAFTCVLVNSGGKAA
jgi:predicted glycosyltransferase involved in capsule biosynthesis